MSVFAPDADTVVDTPVYQQVLEKIKVKSYFFTFFKVVSNPP